ncbi:penicillin-binding transpeptidase domain-containing protein [Agromyces laixinhei]|uniref:penicillin-binding transpeptidase domain-containing protein n=1 Tax=Agromyces laixinhei TaxID=2585717 RepID=UPI0011168F1C|nr:penicillin-binding transpeptidase domain-containing protein [Agromyces laixinhei]
MNRTSRHPMRRILLSAAVLVALVGVFVVRLVDIQIVRAAELNEQAQEARSEPVTVYGARGDIVDANGKVLADTVMRYDIVLSPKQASKAEVVREVPDPENPEATKEVVVPLPELAAELGAVVGLTGDQVQGIITSELAEDPKADYAYVSKLVDTETYEKVKALDIPWVYADEHPSRRYPSGAVAGNLVGWVGPDGNPLQGLELSEDQCLAGENGKISYLHSLQDWVKIPGTEIVHEQAHDGGKLQLTIDTDLQWEVQRIAEAQRQATGADWATVTVMEAKTGRLLAVADVPTVDPNDPSAIDADDRGSRSFTAPYEPGSTFKALTAASVINAGLADPYSRIVAPYRIKFPQRGRRQRQLVPR